MFIRGTACRIHQRRHRARKLFIVADLVENSFRQRLDAVARRIEQLRAKVTEGPFEHRNEKLVADTSVSGHRQITSTQLIQEPSGLLGGGGELQPMNEDRIQFWNVRCSGLLKM